MISSEAPSIRRTNKVALVLALVFSVLATVSIIALFSIERISDEMHHHHYECVDAANSLMSASDYLTSEARMYVMTGERGYADNYLREVHEARRRDKALEVFSDDTKHQESLGELAAAFKTSSELAETELYAMKLVAVATGAKNVPADIENVELSAEDAALSNEQKKQRAQELVLGNEYQQVKEVIITDVSDCTNALILELQEEERALGFQNTITLVFLSIMVVAIVLLLVHTVYSTSVLIVRPLRAHTKDIEEGKPLTSAGAQEVRLMVDSYNAMYEENHQRTKRLEHEAHTDALTGLLNRGSYDRAMGEQTDPVALVLMDVDNFKEINDEFGHSVGDAVLQHVAARLAESFRATDFVCRVGGDEFAVIMTRVRDVDRSIVQRKLSEIATSLRNESGDLPTVTLSIGVAFSGDLARGENIYHAADQALYEAKEQGRDKVCFHER